MSITGDSLEIYFRSRAAFRDNPQTTMYMQEYQTTLVRDDPEDVCKERQWLFHKKIIARKPAQSTG